MSKTIEKPETEAVASTALFSVFKSKWFNNSFYWLTSENFEPLQKIAFEMGLRWHTGDTDVSEFRGQRNLVMFPDGKIQGVDIWHPDASYGQPKNFSEMFAEYQSILENVEDTRKAKQTPKTKE